MPSPLLLLSSARAADTWTSIRTGVDLLHRTNDGPQDIYAVRVDLTLPNVGLHASADNDAERHVNTRTFANNTDMLVAINGDWSDATTPVGLAISDGWHWHDHIHDDTLGSTWGFFACTATKECTISRELPLDQAWWFASPTLSPYRYFQAVGANGCLMLQDGEKQNGCYDTIDNPRSAVCMDHSGTTLWLIAIDGRSGIAEGMTCDETRDLMLNLGCKDGAMLDGGGSTTLVVEGEVVNNPSDGSPRTVANHFGILYSASKDPACQVWSGRWCDGTVMGTCQGGRLIGTGDCAAYGATCQEDGEYAFCVDYRCPGGDGLGSQCLDGTRIAACTDGQYGEGDCGVFGLACGTDDQGSDCMDTRCLAGPHSSFCTDAGLLATCTDGVYAEAACGDGTTCLETDAGSSCLDARCAEAEVCDGDTWISCADGTWKEKDCSRYDFTCSEAQGGCVRPEDLDDGEGGCGCATGFLPGSAALLAGALVVACLLGRTGPRG